MAAAPGLGPSEGPKEGFSLSLSEHSLLLMALMDLSLYLGIIGHVLHFSQNVKLALD